MKLQYGTTNYFKVFDIKATTGGTISSYTSVTGQLVNDATRANVGSSISMTAVSGESNSYEGRFPSSIDFTGIALVRAQVVIVCVVGGNTITLTEESDPIAPTRN